MLISVYSVFAPYFLTAPKINLVKEYLSNRNGEEFANAIHCLRLFCNYSK